MSRKTRREYQKERDIQRTKEEIEDTINGPVDDEAIDELGAYIGFCLKYYNVIAEAGVADPTQRHISNYIISLETMKKYSERHYNADAYKDFNMILTLLSAEAARRGFESLLTYVRFLKLTLLEEEDGEFRIVSENEQDHIKRWVHMKTNFGIKRGISIEMATPESSHVWEVPES